MRRSASAGSTKSSCVPVVDRRRVRRLLQAIADDLAFLRERAGLDADLLLGDREKLAALKYVFITAIEGCLDVAQHFCASEGWGPPASNADAVRLIATRGVLDGPTGEAIAAAVGFRNVLVHGYIDVDDARVIAFLGRLGDFGAFVQQAADWTEAAGD